MWTYILKRVLLMIPTLLGIILITFAVLQFVPGGPVEQMVARTRGGQHASEGGGGSGFNRRDQARLEQEQIDYLNRLYGFDQPVSVQLAGWIKRLFTFDFGESYYHHKKVVDLVAEKLPVSISLGIFSTLIIYLVSIPLGIAKAVREGTRFDTWSSVLIMIGYSTPGFVLGVFLIVLFCGGSFWAVFPLRGLTSDDFATMSLGAKILDYLWHLVLPLICYVVGGFSALVLVTKNYFLDEVNRQYVETARAKGLPEKLVLYKHIFRNSMIPLALGFPATVLGMFFSGSLLIEILFSLDGLGLLSYESILSRDYPVVMATLFFFSLLALIANLLGDLCLVLVDPRITFDQASE